MAKLIAIDLGSHRVKLAVYEGAFGRFQLESLHAAAVPQDAENEPVFGARLAVLAGMLENLPAAKARPGYLYAWPADRASVRHLVLPFGDKAQVEKVLPFEVEGLVPFDMEDMELRHHLLQVAPGDSHVLAAMIERQAIAEAISGLAGVGADPRSIDLDADVLAELAHEDGGVQAIVDLGHTRTVVSICRNGQLVAARALDGGGRTLTAALAQARGCSWEEAESRKHQASLSADGAPAPALPAAVEWEDEEDTRPGVPPTATPPRDLARASADGEVLRRAFVPLLAELRSTLISFEDALSLEIDEIILVGGGRQLAGLRSLLAATLGVPVQMPEPVAEAATDPVPGAWHLVSALGRRGSRNKTGAMELRQGALRFKGDLYLARQVGLYGGVFAAFALIAGTVMFGVRSVQLNRDIESLDAQIRDAVVSTFPGEVSPDRIRTPSDAMAIMTEKTVEVTTRVETLGSIVTDEPPTVALLRDLARAMPPHDEARIDVEELSITASTVTLEAETDGYEAATKIESSLQAFDRFKGARKGDEKRSRSGSVTFKITIPRDREDAEEGEEG